MFGLTHIRIALLATMKFAVLLPLPAYIHGELRSGTSVLALPQKLLSETRKVFAEAFGALSCGSEPFDLPATRLSLYGCASPSGSNYANSIYAR